MLEVVMDFETASGADLKKCGAARYSEDPTTEILSLKYWYDGRMSHWYPRPGGPAYGLCLLAEGAVFWSHAVFEQYIWQNIMVRQYGFPPIPIERWHDTQAVCAMRALPLGLDRGLKVLGLPVTKDAEGRRITLSMSRLDKHGYFPARTPERMAAIYRYNEIDVHGTVALKNRLGRLPDGERAIWELDQRINQRGVALDMHFVRAAQSVVHKSAVPLVREFEALTSGLKPTQVAKVLDWCAAEIGDRACVPNLQKETLARLLELPSDADEDADDEDWDGLAIDQGDCKGGLPTLPGNVRRALYIRSLVGSASVKKLGAMDACVSLDGRARGLFQYHAAGPGRWGGRLLQPQNFPRGTVKLDPEVLVSAIMTEDPGYVEAISGTPPIETVISALRHAIVAGPGRSLVVGDLAAIEARLVLALAGQHDRLAEIAAGQDIYLVFADLAGRPGERQSVGKPGVLGCGYQCGKRNFNSKFLGGEDQDTADLCVDTYRNNFAPQVPRLWAGLEEAALKAVYDRRPYEYHGIRYELEDRWLTCRLPSGRKLWYFDPQPCKRAMPWDDTDIRDGWTFWAMRMGQWRKTDIYGGKLTQHLCEGMGRDLLAGAMLKCDDELPVVMHGHDELVGEGAMSPEWLKQIMEDRPRWAVELGLPVAAECWTGRRYRK